MLFGLDDEQRRGAVELIAKYGVISVSALWVLIAGTHFVAKRSAELDFRNKQLSIASMPLADTTMDFMFNNPPIGGTCNITGQYRIANTGKLNFVIDSVSFSLFALPIVDLPPGQEVRSFSLETQLAKAKPILIEAIPVGQTLSPGNRLERSFGFIVRPRPGHSYIIVANGKGGLAPAGRPSWFGLSTSYSQPMPFGPRDLQHGSALAPICPAKVRARHAG